MEETKHSDCAGIEAEYNTGLHNSNSTGHYAAVVYSNRHGQIRPICVPLVRFYYVNTLKMQQFCKKSYFSKDRQN